MSIIIEVAEADALAGVNAFYATVGYGGGVAASDVVLVAKDDGCLVGVVRLCAEGGFIVLRGMQVAPEYQRMGIGKNLLNHCLPYLDRGTAYCLPYEHLVDFYGKAGFVAARSEALPEFLAQRLAGYVASGQRTLAMLRVTSQS